ncbi:MAG: AraC family transcriptional regulator [Roseivirga sp.]|nr:AraC family transcriptional regulator [Roseivirga sp.]
MTAVFDLYTFTGIFTSGLTLFLIMVLAARKKSGGLHRSIVALLLWVLGFNVVHDTLVHAQLLSAFPHMLYTGELPNLLIWPLIYLYLVISPEQSFSWKHSLHLIPFTLYNLSRISEYASSATSKIAVLEAFEAYLIETQYIISKTWSLTSFLTDFVFWRLQGIIYIGLIVYLLFYSNKKPYKLAAAGMVFKVIFIGFVAIWLSKYVIHLLPYLHPTSVYLSNKAEILLNASQITLISFWCIKEPVLRASEKSTSPAFVLSADQLALLGQKLKALFQQESLHLQRGINIHQVAKKLNTNANYLSRVVNTEFHSSFTDWVNLNRVNEMQERLRAPQFEHLTIEAIAKDSGFNSAVTCNRAFKKFLNASPSAIRKMK